MSLRFATGSINFSESLLSRTDHSEVIENKIKEIVVFNLTAILDRIDSSWSLIKVDEKQKLK